MKPHIVQRIQEQIDAIKHQAGYHILVPKLERDDAEVLVKDSVALLEEIKEMME